MQRQLILGSIFLIFSSLVACGNQVKQSINKTVADNQKAESILDWEQSEAHPEHLFKKWRAEYASEASRRQTLQSDICTELLNLEAQALTLFENEIRNSNNFMLVQSCKQELLSAIEQYYESERMSLDVRLNVMSDGGTTNSFQFPVNIQKRDTSNGYFAVTGDVARKEVILTFDDGPSGVYTQSILRSLREVNAKAMFFMLGKNVRANPDIVRKVAQDGHAVGSHSRTHACLGTSRACGRTNGHIFSFEEAVAEIKGGHQAIQDTLGWVDPFFRFPYGEASPELKNFLKSNSVGEFYWSIDSEDWRAQSNDTLLKNTLSRLEQKGRGNILFHDIQRKTAEILPTLLKELYTRGYSVVLLQSADEAARYNSKIVNRNLP